MCTLTVQTQPNTTVTAKTLLFLFIALIIYDPVHFRDY